MIKRILSLVLSVALSSASLASDLPDLGDVSSSVLSTADEKRIGDSIIQDIRWRDPAYLDDPEIESYINRLGQRLVAASDEPGRRFEFFVIQDPSLNAFALPGGYIGLHTGLILAAQSESELASVIGHEVAHVTQRHIAQLYGKQSEMGMMVLASMVVAILAARSNPSVSQAAIASGQAGAMQSQIGYTRGFEREADRIGLQSLEAGGFDVRGMPSFFERLQRSTRLYENNAPAYLRTHPLTQERIADMDNRVAQMRYRQVPDSPDFGFVRAKIRANEGLASDAIRYFEAQLKSNATDLGSRYGLIRAQLRAGETDAASAGIEKLLETSEPSPFVATLAAEIDLAIKQPLAAVEILQAAVKRFPEHRALEYALIDAQLEAGQADEAAMRARDASIRYADDPRMWALSSRAESQRGRITAHHRAQAEVYVLQGALPAAIEQLEFARQANDGDFFDLSAVDARMRALKLELSNQKEASSR